MNGPCRSILLKHGKVSPHCFWSTTQAAGWRKKWAGLKAHSTRGKSHVREDTPTEEGFCPGKVPSVCRPSAWTLWALENRTQGERQVLGLRSHLDFQSTPRVEEVCKDAIISATGQRLVLWARHLDAGGLGFVELREVFHLSLEFVHLPKQSDSTQQWISLPPPQNYLH